MTGPRLQVKSYPRTWILGWSVSRYDTFTTCPRQYYYQYYGRYDPVIPREKIDHLKRLTTLPMEVGAVTHDIIAVILQRLQTSTAPIDGKRFSRYVHTHVTETFGKKNFCETHYGEKDHVDPADSIPEVLAFLENFLESERYGRLVESAGRGDPWLIEPPHYGETRLDGMKAFCKPDFVCAHDEMVRVFDWKTGRQKPEHHDRQLNAYACWASAEFNVLPENIRAFAAYLSPRYEEFQVEESLSVTHFLTRVRRETEEMYALLEDVKENRPKAKEAFPMMDPSPVCGWCNFRELCGR